MTLEITRRRACGLLFGDLIGTVACAQPSREVSKSLANAAHQHDLAILDLGAIRTSSGSELRAVTVGGARAGKVVLPESERPCQIAVSPDGRWMAWDNWSALPWSEGTKEPPQVFIMKAPESVRSLSLKDGFGTSLAISSNAEHIALVSGNIDSSLPPRRLIVLSGATVEIEHDVTDLISQSDLAQAGRLGISGEGNRLAVGFAERFVVIDIPSHKALLEDRGRLPALSPDGEFLAFVNHDKQLTVVSLSTGIRRTLLGAFGRTLGVGAWSPNGRYLLAGAVKTLSFSVQLVAVEYATNRFAEIRPLGEFVGKDHVWVKRDLLHG